MRMGIRKAASLLVLLVLTALGPAACGSGSESTTTTAARPAVSRDTADHLAKLSNRIAADLDGGDLCHAAHSADDLSAAVEDSDLPANLRPGVETVATDLVNQVNCPPPPPPPPAPEPERKPKAKPKEHGNGDEHGNKNGDVQEKGPSKHGELVPPGHAKLKGEQR